LTAAGIGVLLLSLPRSGAANTPPVPFCVVSDSQESLLLSFALPDYTLRQVSAQGSTFVQVQAAGLSWGVEPGVPQLPEASALIALPPTGGATSRILSIERTIVPLSYPVYPAPAPAPVYVMGEGPAVTQVHPARTDVLSPAGAAYEFAQDKAIYARDVFYPADAVDLTEVGWLRGQRVARVTLHPFRYNPVRGELEAIERLVLEVRFGGDGGPSAAAELDASSPAFEHILDRALLNPETARGWRTRSPMLAAAAAPNVPATQAGSYKITVDEDGLYRLTYADLQNAGLPVESINPQSLQLFEQGQEVAIRVTGQSDGTLDAGDSLTFYGSVPRSRYTDHNVYWLRYGDATGLRIVPRDATPGGEPDGVAWATARYEEDLFYDSHFAAADGDHWYAADLRPDTGHAATVTLMPPAADGPVPTLRVWLVGYTRSWEVDPDHHATFAVNGHTVGGGGLWWDGAGAVDAMWTMDPTILGAGDNVVTVSLPGDTGAHAEGTWLDAVELSYSVRSVVGDEITFQGQAGAHRYALDGFTGSSILLYDVTDPQHPVRLEGSVTAAGDGYALSFSDAPPQPVTYLALTSARVRSPVSIVADTPSNLRDGSNGADYLIVTHADYVGAVQPLVAHRQAQGMRVAVVKVQDVYDEFSGGLLDPRAIRDFVAYAYTHWTPLAPTYVLLVGDGSYDYLDHHGYGSTNDIPPYLDMVDPWWGETAADNRYAAISGDDPLPDVLLGRLPVTTADEATTVVHKILQYEQSPWLGDWNARHVFVADDASSVSDFRSTFDAVYDAYVAESWSGRKIYLDGLPVEAARQETLSAWRRGALLMSFAGHSSWHQWAVEALFDIHDLPEVYNDRRWPVVLSMTCFTGFFHHPEYGTLDEELLRLDGGGAVATWSPSGLGVATGHDHLYLGFYRAVFYDGQAQIGPAALAAKMYLYSQVPAYADLLETYHLFGDPALSLNLTIRPWPYSTYLSLVSKNR
jgi:hypothetical protein